LFRYRITNTQIIPGPHARPHSWTLIKMPELGPSESKPPLDTGLGAADASGHPLAGAAAGPASVLALAEAPGELGRLGPYRVLRVLGQGGMGFVFHGEDTVLHRPVALKVMRPDLSEGAAAAERFLREGRAAAALKSDHVITIYQVGQANGVPYLAMEYLEGMTLEDWLNVRSTRPSHQAVLKVARDVLRGLTAAHEKGLIHRDIKPSNLWVETPGGRIKLLDFGLTQGTAAQAPRLTQDGLLLGTPTYMPPEQAAGERVDGRADIFSLGAVLYRMLAGRAPFQRNSLPATLLALATEAPVPLDEDVPPVLRDFIGRLLAKDPAWRPADAKSALAEVMAIERQLRTPGETPSSSASAIVPAFPVVTEEVVSLKDMPPSQVMVPSLVRGQRGTPALVGAGAALILVFFLAALALPALRKGPITKEDETTIASADVRKVRPDERPRTKLAPPEKSRPPAETTKGDATPPPSVAVETKKVEAAKPAETRAATKKKATVAITTPALPPATPVVWPASMTLPAFKELTFHPVPTGKSPLDQLDPKSIPAEERFHGQPKELVAVIGSHAHRHWSSVTAVAISPDGRWAATGSWGPNAEVFVWEMATQRPKHRIADAGASVTAMAFSADGRRLFVSYDGPVKVYDLTGATARAVPIPAPAKPVDAFRADIQGHVLERGQTWLSQDSRGGLVLFDISGEVPARTAALNVANRAGEPTAVVAEEVNRVVYLARDGTLHKADVRNGRFQDDAVLPLEIKGRDRPRAITPDGSRLAIWDGPQLAIWDIESQPPAIVQRLKADGHLVKDEGHLALSPDARQLIVQRGRARLYRLDGEEGKSVGWLDSTGFWANRGAVAFSRDSQRAVVVNDQGFVRFWDVSEETPRELSQFDLGTAYPTPSGPGSYTLDGARGRLIVPRYDGADGGRGERFEFWDLTGKRAGPMAAPSTFLEPANWAWPINATRCLVQWRDQPFHWSDLRDGRWSDSGSVIAPGEKTRGLLSADGSLLVTARLDEKSELAGWDMTASPPTRSWALALDTPLAAWPEAAISADQRLLATVLANAGEPGGELVLWKDLDGDAAPAARLPIKLTGLGAYRMALSPDGHWLAHNPRDPTELVLVDLSGSIPREMPTIDLGTVDRTWFYAFSFSPDGRKLAWARNGPVGVFDLTSGQPSWGWKAPGVVNWLEWAPDGRHLITYNGNKTLYVLRFPSWGKTAVVGTSKAAPRTKRP
jgi:serine/threonine protein kinase/WD40 repeat protein